MSAQAQIDPIDIPVLIAALKQMREAKEVRLLALSAEMETLGREAADLDLRIARYTNASLAGEDQSSEVSALFDTPSGRAKRGETEKVIAAKLSETEGNGATIGELSHLTGAKYSTVRRILIAMAEDKRVFVSYGRWHHRHPSLTGEPPPISVNGNGERAEEGHSA